MSKKANQNQRRKGSDKKKNTFKKYGKNTQKGVRIKQTMLENQSRNLKNKNQNQNKNQNKKKNQNNKK
jgi:hypothetical protein